MVKERYGILKKIESLRLIEDNAVLKNTLAFECPEPFPGYYGNHKDENNPLFVYLVLRDSMNMEDFLEMNAKVHEADRGNKFHATLATITAFEDTYNAIRINRISDYAVIARIQGLFIQEGAGFHPFSQRYKFIERGFIRIKKFFFFQPVDEGYCFDKYDDFHGYFCIDEHMNIERFEKIVKQVDRNIDIIDFDAALSSYYENYKVHNMVRIYTESLNVELLKRLKQEFLAQMSKPI